VILGLGAALGAAVLYGVAAVLQAAGARQVGRAQTMDPRVMTRILRQPAAVTALGLMLLGFLLHLLAVRLVPLFLAQAGIAVSLVVTALLAVVRFGERLSRREWIAVTAVFGGLVLLSASAGDVGESTAGRIPLVLAVAIVVIVGLAWFAGRSHSPLSTAALGLLAGFGYAIVGISARLLPGFGAMQLLTSPVTWTLVVGGSLAFFLYSLALQRGAVTLATTPMIVSQTVTPAAVGVLMLGDGVRSGWALPALAGFLVTVAAASVLVRFEGGHGGVTRSEHPQPLHTPPANG
jgi:drug/metabolite transporter (DMT)-like permease